MKKGFTLIELLAVIVILAILALIVSPIISGVISDAKKAAAERSMEGYVKAVEFAQVEYQGKNKGSYAKELTDLTVNYSGNTVSSPNVTFTNGLVTEATATISGYTCTYENHKAECNKGGSTNTEIAIPVGSSTLPAGLQKGRAVYFNPVDNKTCSNYNNNNSLTTVKEGCMKWYVYKDNGNGTYQLILDHNTTPHVAWITLDDYVEAGGNSADFPIKNGAVDKGPVTVNKQLASDTINWAHSLNTRLITADEIAAITGDNLDPVNWSSATAGVMNSFYFGTGSTRDTTLSATNKSKYAWLFDNLNGCLKYGCNSEDNNTYDNVDKSKNGVTNNYWTSSRVYNINGAWFADNSGGICGLYSPISEVTMGVRPVITV